VLAIFGPWEQPIFEGWSLLSGLAAVTERVRLGLMVGANTFRNPGLTAKMAITLDHISGGRAVLGIGGAWFEREHEAFGVPFRSGFGERLDMLDEAVEIMRRLFDGERFGYVGQFYTMLDALAEPRPVQPHLPILVGGSGPKKTLRTVALRADAWNTSGYLDEVREKLSKLEAHCTDVGRDMATIDKTISFPIVIRDTAGGAEAAFADLMRRNQSENAGNVPNLLGPPEYVADQIRPYRDMGFSTVICRMPAPYDRETIDRIGEVSAIINDD
jgi:alkanesulfonate monooxygenase SsuD/methylene tetrahydromethanopterin reductase-like flavin-dependent oxidoreductase (luciferase family)